MAYLLISIYYGSYVDSPLEEAKFRILSSKMNQMSSSLYLKHNKDIINESRNAIVWTYDSIFCHKLLKPKIS